MTRERQRRGASLVTVSAAVGITNGTLSRIERGIQIPKRPQARALFKYYGGRLTLGQCYEPTHEPPAAARKRARK
jgi:transcriptional regulator with XRE-family HTH domain